MNAFKCYVALPNRDDIYSKSVDNAYYSVVHYLNWSNFEIFTIMVQIICMYPTFILTQLSSNKGRNELKPIGSRPVST